MSGPRSVAVMRVLVAAAGVRLILALLFSSVGFLGGGGDGEFYHLAGRFAQQLLFSPLGADYASTLEELSDEHNLDSYSVHAGSLEALRDGGLTASTSLTVVPVVVAHALVYALWDDPLAFPLLNILVSVLAIGAVARTFPDGDRVGWLLALNPVSVFFAATHFKESLTESAILLLLAAMTTPRRWGLGAVGILLLAVFRLPFVPLALAAMLLLSPATPRVRLPAVILGCLLVLLIAPSFYSGSFLDIGRSGPIYSAIHANELTRRLLSPLVGMLVPVPFMIPLSSGNWYFGVFELVYAVCYHACLAICAVHALLARRPTDATRWVAAGIALSMVTGYLVLAASGAKERYFAPFFPVLVIAAWRAWRELRSAAAGSPLDVSQRVTA